MGGVGDVCRGYRLNLQSYKSWLQVSGLLGRYFGLVIFRAVVCYTCCFVLLISNPNDRPSAGDLLTWIFNANEALSEL